MDDMEKTPAPADNIDDTKTRKTVILKPSIVVPPVVTPATATDSVKTVVTKISDPLTGRDTDTGNLEIMADTQTRRTVKLKPIAPPPVNNEPIKIQSGSVSGENTQTRKTVVLKSSTVAAPSDVKVADGANTQTRKTVVLKTASVATPADVKVADGDNTQTRKTVVLKSSTVAAPTDVKLSANEVDDTVKIQRPVRAPLIPPGQTPPATSSLIPPGKKTVVISEDPKVEDTNTAEMKTVKLEPPKLKSAGAPSLSAGPGPRNTGMVPPPLSAGPAPRATGTVTPPPAPVAPAPVVDAAVAAAPVAPAVAAPKADEDDIPALVKPPVTSAPAASDEEVKTDEDGLFEMKKVDSHEVKPAAGITGTVPFTPIDSTVVPAARPSAFYLVVAALTLLCVIGTATLTVVEYLNLCQGQHISLPFLKK